MHLVVEVVQEAGLAPDLLILPEFPGIGAHRRLDGEHVFDKGVVLGVFVDECYCVGARHE